MPIYAYRCANCGFEKEYLQKMSDPVMTVCPECNQAAFQKKLTAAGFQLKGTGWYVTDFRNGSTPAKKADEAKSPEAAADQADGKSDGKSDSKGDGKADSKADAKGDTKGDTKAADSAAAASAPAPSPSPPSTSSTPPSTSS